MPTTEFIQKRLSTVACPLCQKNEFHLNPKGQKHQEEQAYTAICLGCHYSFPVSSENTLYRQANPDIVYRLREIPCPKCEGRGAELEFRAMISIRDSRQFLRCGNCRFEFNESTPAEAFE